MKQLLFFCLFFQGIMFSCLAQQAVSIEENQPANYDGLVCGFNIRNERVMEIGKENFNRFEVTVYITNQSGCPKIVLLNDTFRNSFGILNDPAIFAIFDCQNATGKRLTSKSASVRANQFFIPVRIPERGADGKETIRTVNTHAGFILRNGETIAENMIIIVPEGERPRMQARVVVFSNL
ncbi:ABC transporter permease [Thermoflexibacter ruber]|uniref:Uncharacterized protein n=1 Tax=Thermoflexibacter ruber TaxID=1003 RepID=A0A1I2HKI4_9BACT|nr:ABC transporter permease [Thermoflexibacter ruber]SFF29800.1 hypothetical protein SAMN04488541_102444 [Thermoflexibacter ruber]